MKKNNIIQIIIIFILIVIIFLMFNGMNKMNKKFDNYESAIVALNDTIVKTVNNNFTTYTKKAPEIDIKTLINSEFFKTLSKDQQKFYRELKNIKGLISSTNAQLRKQGILIDSLNASKQGAIIDSNKISFDLGKELAFSEKDTTKHLQYKASVILDSIINFKLDYDYKVNIQTSYERQKDKSILVKYKIDDPELEVTDMQNFTIPVKYKNNFDKWYQNNRRTINIIGGAILVGAGGYVGYQIAK